MNEPERQPLTERLAASSPAAEAETCQCGHPREAHLTSYQEPTHSCLRCNTCRSFVAASGVSDTREGDAVPICGTVCACGPNLEPLACGFPKGHDGAHAWATLPTFPIVCAHDKFFGDKGWQATTVEAFGEMARKAALYDEQAASPVPAVADDPEPRCICVPSNCTDETRNYAIRDDCPIHGPGSRGTKDTDG